MLADWRWFYEVIEWPSAPKTFQTFWGKVESSGLLTLLCETSEYEKKWKDPLIYHLGEMWIAGQVLRLENAIGGIDLDAESGGSQRRHAANQSGREQNRRRPRRLSLIRSPDAGVGAT